MSTTSIPSPPPEPTETRGAVIVITGLAGVGKYTTASRLHSLLNPHEQGPPSLYAARSTFFHNHLVIDPAQALVSRTQSPSAHMALRRAHLTQAVDVMAANPDRERIFILTAYVTMGVDGQRLRLPEMQMYVDLAARRGVPFLWFRLVCAPDEHRLRIQDERRKDTKIRDYERLVEAVGREHDGQVEWPNDELDIQRVFSFCHEELVTTGTTPEQTAEAILSRIRGPLNLN